MKLIPKLQEGGFARFFSTYRPVFGEYKPQSGTSAKEKKKEDSSKGKLTEKDLYSMLKDLDGLPNEMQNLVTGFINTLEMSSLLGSDTTDLATLYMRALGQVKTAKFNKELYDNAYKEAEKNKALNDIAITTDGGVLVQTTDGELHTLTPELYVLTKDNNEYKALTNSNLLWLRAHHPGYINNNSMLSVVENGIGLEEVHKMIKDRSSKLGSTTNTLETFLPKEIIKGNELLEAAIGNGPDGYYKWKQSLTRTEESLVNAALQYIYQTLPNNAKTRLQLATKDGTAKEALLLILESLVSGTSASLENTFSYLSEASRNGDSKETGTVLDNLKGMDSNMAFQFLLGRGSRNQITLNPGTPNGIVAYGVTVPVTNAEGKNVGALAPASELTTGEFGALLDINNITIGGQPIPISNLSGVLLKDGKITSIDFPCKEINGRIVPIIDPLIVKAKSDADKEIALKGININEKEEIKKHYQEINDVYISHGLDPAYDANGEPIGNWKHFAVANVYTNDNILGLGIFDKNALMREITNNTERDNLIKQFNDADFDVTDWILNPFDSKNRMFEGTMWIPIDDTLINSLSRTTKVGQAMEVDDRQRIMQREDELKSKINNGTPNLT